MKRTYLALGTMIPWLLVSCGPQLAQKPPLKTVFDFEDGTLQGWTPSPVFGGVLLVSSNGHPGYCMEAMDTAAGGSLSVRAPSAWSGDLSSYAGALWDECLPGLAAIRAQLVVQHSNGTTYLTLEEPGTPRDSWFVHQIDFDSRRWGLVVGSGTNRFDEVLNNVKAVWLSLDTSKQGSKEARVDNIRLVPRPHQ